MGEIQTKSKSALSAASRAFSIGIIPNCEPSAEIVLTSLNLIPSLIASSLMLMLTHLQNNRHKKSVDAIAPTHKDPACDGNLINPFKKSEGESHRRLLHCWYNYIIKSPFVKHFLNKLLTFLFEIFVNRFCSGFSGTHSQNYGCGTGYGVTTGINTCLCGLHIFVNH